MDIYAEIVATTGKAVTASGHKAAAVLETPDFRRIRDLPRRSWETAADLDRLVALLTEHVRTPAGGMSLKPVQAAALRELHDVGGLFAIIRVGGGKTLISLLAAQILQAKRPLLIIPSGLRDKTRHEMYQLARHFNIQPITITGYELISRDYGPLGKEGAANASEAGNGYLNRCGSILGQLEPDLIIADEVHRLKNTRAGVTRKVRAYIQGARKAGKTVHFAGLTGTITSRSLRDYWHILRWALGTKAPIPLDLDEFKTWSLALDEGVDAESRTQPGALPRLSPDLSEVRCLTRDCRTVYLSTLDQCPECGTLKDDIVVARSAYCDRLVSSPGVISTKEDRPGMSLVITAREVPAPEPVRDAIKHMRATWTTPDGHPFEMAVELWSHCREAQCGFYYVWDPRPPADWLAARKAWSRYVRDSLGRSRTYHTTGHIIQAIDRGLIRDEGVYLLGEWRAIADTFKPRTVPVWIDDTVLRWAASWITKSDHRLCWVEHRCVGERLSELTGVPFFSRKGCDPRGNLVDKHKGPAIVSIDACKTGRNLQYRWYENLYMSPSSVPDDWEQSLGRTHRDGQPQDEVTAEILMMAAESYSSLVYAIRRAGYVEQTTSQPQKLLYATRDLGSVEALISRRNDDMWKQEVGV